MIPKNKQRFIHIDGNKWEYSVNSVGGRGQISVFAKRVRDGRIVKFSRNVDSGTPSFIKECIKNRLTVEQADVEFEEKLNKILKED